MSQVQRALRFMFYSVWAIFMTGLTYILGAPTLKVLRRRLGRANYWALNTGLACGVYALTPYFGVYAWQIRGLAIAFFSLVVLIGVFEEFEDMEFSFPTSVFFTLLINSLLAGGAFALWVSVVGPHWSEQVIGTLDLLFKPLGDVNAKLRVSSADIAVQLPSIAIILWIISIYVAILLEGKLMTGDMAVETKTPSMRSQLGALRLPDAIVWLFIAAILGAFSSFLTQAVSAVAVNVLNVCIVLFFFQGIAVVAKFFESIRLGVLWQSLFMLVIVVQLFLFVSVLGLVDFWLDFRGRMAKRAEGFNREDA